MARQCNRACVMTQNPPVMAKALAFGTLIIMVSAKIQLMMEALLIAAIPKHKHSVTQIHRVLLAQASQVVKNV
jgi:hypothetical protein